MSIPKTYARKSNLSIILLREILSKTFCDLNYEAILSPVFVWIIAFVSAAFLIVAYGMAPSLVKVGRELVSETSPWSGVRRIDQGFFIDPKSSGPSIAAVEIGIESRRFYTIEVKASCRPGMSYSVDFYGANYDFAEQEAKLSCDKSGEHLIFYSHKVPKETYIRIMFLSPDEAVKIESIHVYEMPAYLNLVRRVLLVLSGLILPAAALWLRQYKSFTALLLGISLLFIYTNYSLRACLTRWHPLILDHLLLSAPHYL